MRRMKLIATGLLVLMAIIFYTSLYFEHVLPWLRIVRAFSEASMIGALADWFAVVVLFRRPLGIPSPHTAIIPKSKDRIGSILGGFVVGNFLTEEVIKNHLTDMVREEEPKKKAVWKKLTGADHFFHALAFMTTAVKLHTGAFVGHKPEESRTSVLILPTSVHQGDSNKDLYGRVKRNVYS